MYSVTIFLKPEDLNKCRTQLEEMASIIGTGSELYQACREGFDNAEEIDAEISDTGTEWDGKVDGEAEQGSGG
jgi:hypothetical protein